MTTSKGQRARRGTRQLWVKEQQGQHFCGCGCGEPIPLKPEHFSVGVPKYLHGHNAKVNPPKARKELPPQTPCECGCGALASPGRRYLRGHWKRPPLSLEALRRISEALSGPSNPNYGKCGSDSPTWKGGRTRTSYGYIDVMAPEHPYAKNGRYVPEHRLLMEDHLRSTDPRSEFLTPDGYLSPGADVHHANEIRHDNRIENLRVMWKGEHTRLHGLQRRTRDPRAEVIAALERDGG